MKTVILAFVIFTGATVLRADSATESARAAELHSILSAFNKAPDPESAQAYLGHPAGWLNLELHRKLEKFIADYPSTDEAVTAELWLNIGKIQLDESASGDGLKQRHHARSEALKKLAEKAPLSWQGKAARLVRAETLLGAQNWDEFYPQTMQILDEIHSYQNEANPGFKAFLETAKLLPEEIEPNIRRLHVTAACYEGKLDKALRYAEELQAKFPEWSKRKHIGGDINQLKKGESPYRLR